MLSTSPTDVVAPAATGRSAPASLQAPGFFLAGGLLLVLAGWFVHARGLDAGWMLGVHASAPGAVSIYAWSCLTVAGLGWSAFILLLAVERRGERLAPLVVPTFVLGGLLTHIPKALLAVPRPAGTDIASHLHVIGRAFTGPVSMPSGHAVTAAGAAALIALVLVRAPLARVVVLLVGAVIASSRVVVGAHWPSDVLVGSGLGLASAAVVVGLARYAPTGGWATWLSRRLSATAGQRWIAVAELAAAAGLLSEKTGYPAGTAMVWALAALAVVSAALRWRASRAAGAGTS